MILGDGLEEIGMYAFSECTSLPSIVIPNAAKTIKYGVFLSAFVAWDRKFN